MAADLPADTLRRILLRQPTRGQVFDAIRGRPGTHVRELSRLLDVALGTIEHHVRTLEKHGLVFAIQAGRRRTLFVTGEIDVRDAQMLHVLVKPVCAGIMRGLLERPEIGVAELAQHLDLPPTSLGHHLRRMRDHGMVVHHQVGRESIYLVIEPVRVRRLLDQVAPRIELVDAATIDRLVPAN